MLAEEILSVRNLRKSFYSDFWKPRAQVLHDVSFSLPRGEAIGFLGANGAGKTTALKIILGLINADSGEVSFASDMGRKREQILNNIGYLPERPYFYPHLTGRQYCHFVSKLSNQPAGEFESKLEELAHEFSIAHALERKLFGYSKGMLQRIGLVSALIHGPKLVFLDEPMSGLDPIGRREIKDVILSLKEKGVTVFFSTHIVADIEEICDSLVVLKEGRCLYNGPIAGMLAQSPESQLTIHYSLNNKVLQRSVHSQQANEALAELIASGAVVRSVQSDHPKLEELIYRIQEKK